VDMRHGACAAAAAGAGSSSGGEVGSSCIQGPPWSWFCARIGLGHPLLCGHICSRVALKGQLRNQALLCTLSSLCLCLWGGVSAEPKKGLQALDCLTAVSNEDTTKQVPEPHVCNGRLPSAGPVDAATAISSPCCQTGTSCDSNQSVASGKTVAKCIEE
jgi:hypothetical protein